VILIGRTIRKIRSLENYWDWSQSACRLAGADYDDLDTLNAKMIHTGWSDVRWWRMTELVRDGNPRKTWWDMDSFNLSSEDAQDRNQWRLKIRQNQITRGVRGKRLLKRGFLFIEYRVSSHETRVSSHENRVLSHKSGVSSHENRVLSHKSQSFESRNPSFESSSVKCCFKIRVLWYLLLS